MKKIIEVAGIVLLGIMSGLIYILYRTGKEMTMSRCGCHK